VTTFPSEEVIKLGEALVKWATEITDDNEPLRSRFCEWYTLPEIGLIKKEWEALIKLDEFRGYYERAQAALGRRLIDGTINPSIGHRFMWHYVPEAKEQELERMRREAELKIQADSNKDSKIVFEVNYNNGTNNPVQISPKNVSTTDSECSE
jgi:hypothetical protein